MRERAPDTEQGSSQDTVSNVPEEKKLSRSDLGLERILWEPEECGADYQLEVQGYKARIWSRVVTLSLPRGDTGTRFRVKSTMRDGTPGVDSVSVRQCGSEPQFCQSAPLPRSLPATYSFS